MTSPIPSAEIDAELARRSFRHFIRQSFPIVDPGARLVGTWYIDAIADHMEAVLRGMLGKTGGIRKLVINIQHRSLKSTIVGVMWPCWTWLQEPWIPFLTAARNHDLAIRDSTKSRKLLQSEWYRSLVARKPDGSLAWEFAEDQNQKNDFLNTANGRRTATFRGGGTGYGGLGLVADDILSIDDRFSLTEIDHANRWLEAEFFTRQNDPNRSAIVLNMHRLCPGDPSDHAIELGWDQLCLPTEYDPADRKRATSIGWEDPRKEPGESLCAARWTPTAIAEEKSHLGEFYEAICNQRPRNRSGAILKDLIDLPRWEVVPENARPAVSIDPAFKGLDVTKPKAHLKRSRVGLIEARTTLSKIYITSVICDWMDFKRLTAMTKAAAGRSRGAPIYVEDEADGPALLTTLESEVPGLIGVDPGHGPGGGSKYERFVAVEHYFRSGSILFPPDSHAPWVRPLIARVLSYPSVEYDDDIDALTQLIRKTWIEDGAEARMRRALALAQ